MRKKLRKNRQRGFDNMDTMDAIKTRRSIRSYQKKELTEQDIKEVLVAAMQAPSAGNEQPWQFVVINSRELLEKIPTIHIYASMVKDAAIAILVCGDVNAEKYKGFWTQDCSAATENLLLAAHARGIGAVWCGLYPNEERMKDFAKMFFLPTNIIPFALVPMGYPAEEKKPENRYKADRVHHNKW
jgi:nitroreductase